MEIKYETTSRIRKIKLGVSLPFLSLNQLSQIIKSVDQTLTPKMLFKQTRFNSHKSMFQHLSDKLSYENLITNSFKLYK